MEEFFWKNSDEQQLDVFYDSGIDSGLEPGVWIVNELILCYMIWPTPGKDKSHPLFGAEGDCTRWRKVWSVSEVLAGLACLIPLCALTLKEIVNGQFLAILFMAVDTPHKPAFVLTEMTPVELRLTSMLNVTASWFCWKQPWALFRALVVHATEQSWEVN